MKKIKTDHSCLTAVKASAHGPNCSFISLIKSENQRKGNVGQRLPESFRIETFTGRQACVEASGRIHLPFLEDGDSQDTLNRKSRLQENEKQRTGPELQQKDFESKMPLFMTQAREFIAGGATSTRDIQNRFYYGTDQVFQSQLLIT